MVLLRLFADFHFLQNVLCLAKVLFCPFYMGFGEIVLFSMLLNNIENK